MRLLAEQALPFDEAEARIDRLLAESLRLSAQA